MSESHSKSDIWELQRKQDSVPRMSSNRSEAVDMQEESPAMRSVALATGNKFSNAQLDGKQFTGLFKHPAVDATMAKPSLGFARPKAGLRSVSEGRQSSGLKKELQGPTKFSTFDVKKENLEPVPWEFPLERTHREVFEDVSVVARRISESLRRLSVEAEYCPEKAKAKCKTVDYVQFRIRLYASGENRDGVVVELQRRSGSTSSFMQTCRAILDAAEGKSLEEPQIQKDRRLPFLAPVSAMKCLASVVSNETGHESAASVAMEGVQDMIKSERRDSNILGLENLCCLTDPSKTNPRVAALVAKQVICGGDKYDIREEIRLLTERDVFSSDFDEEQGKRHRDQLHYLALCVFSNALTLCSKDGSLASALNEQWFSEFLIPSLIDELGRVETNAINACQAARCLLSIVESSPSACKTLVDGGVFNVLVKAHEFGKTQHAALENETRCCLKLVRAHL